MWISFNNIAHRASAGIDGENVSSSSSSSSVYCYYCNHDSYNDEENPMTDGFTGLRRAVAELHCSQSLAISLLNKMIYFHFRV